MGVKHAIKFARQTIAHRVGSYKDKSVLLANKNRGHSNFISPDP